MKRKATKDIEEWFNSARRKPLIVRGARQVGKTWLINDFADRLNPPSLYVNFEDDKPLRDLFVQDFDMERILERLSFQKDRDITPETLIIFDEIQEAPQGVTALKYFAEKLPRQPIIAAGSLLGIAMHSGDSFPVGKVDFLDIFPMDFEEFLWATGNDRLASLINKKDRSTMSSVRDKFIRLLRSYYFVGGMPMAVSSFSETGNYNEARRIQTSLLSSYDNDFSKHAPVQMVPRIRQVWNSIVAQLSKENKKFVFGLVREGARAREYELALEWLYDAGLFYRVGRVKKGELPLKAYQDESSFKVFMLDIGLLCAMCGVTPASVVEDNKLLGGFKGGLAEQYVLQQLRPMKGLSIHYWSADNSNGEIDFLLQKDDRIIPVEVKAEENLQSKSLKVFSQKYNLTTGLRFSMSDFRDQGWMKNVPLYAIASAL